RGRARRGRSRHHGCDDGPRRREPRDAARDRPAQACRAPRRGAALHGSRMTHVVIVGGGFAGVACARKLASNKDVRVTLIDKNDYHKFQPLLYQVATSMLAARDIAYPLRKIAAEFQDFDSKRAEVVAIDPVAKTVTT